MFRRARFVLPVLLTLALAAAMKTVAANGPVAPANGPAATTQPAGGKPLSLEGLANPVWRAKFNLRDPAVLKTDDGYRVYFSRVSGAWANPKSWAIGCVSTKDFREFTDDHDVSPKGFASPDAPVLWHGRYVMAFQSYPAKPVRLCYVSSTDLKEWSKPVFFLEEAAQLPWNTQNRVIDPTFVVDGRTLHCFFIGSSPLQPGPNQIDHANLMGHAITTDPQLKKWDILTKEAPLIGISERAPDGVENMVILKTGSEWTMIYSEGLKAQHLAYAKSTDLIKWDLKGTIDVPSQKWMAAKHGAPFVWKEPDRWMMILMGTDKAERTTFGLLSSPEGIAWKPLPEK